jgi:hypothetical protein
MKNGTSWHPIVSPYCHFFNKNNFDDIIEAFRLMTSGHLRKYIGNTCEFLKGATNYQDGFEIIK